MKTLLAAVLSLGLITSAVADSPYQKGEAQVSAFATHSYSKPAFNSTIDYKDGEWGYGLGLTYFFHRNLGLGGDVVVLDSDQAPSTGIDEINFQLVARVPIGETGLAPYLTAGGGRNIESGEWHGAAAAGLELRTGSFSVFAEGRYAWVREENDTAQLRTGIRWAF